MKTKLIQVGNGQRFTPTALFLRAQATARAAREARFATRFYTLAAVLMAAMAIVTVLVALMAN